MKVTPIKSGRSSSREWPRWKRLAWLLGLASLVIVLVASSLVAQTSRALAADKILLSYGPIQQTLAVEDLSAFVRGGPPTKPLDQLISAANLSPDQVRQLFSKAIPFPATTMDEVVNSYIGGVILGQVGLVVLPGVGVDPVQALKTALVQGVQNDQISLLSVIKAYPSPVMTLDGQKAMAIYTQVKQDAQNLPDIIKAVNPLLQQLLPGLSIGMGCPPSTPAGPNPGMMNSPTPGMMNSPAPGMMNSPTPGMMNSPDTDSPN